MSCFSNYDFHSKDQWKAFFFFFLKMDISNQSICGFLWIYIDFTCSQQPPIHIKTIHMLTYNQWILSNNWRWAIAIRQQLIGLVTKQLILCSRVWGYILLSLVEMLDMAGHFFFKKNIDLKICPTLTGKEISGLLYS